MTDTQSPSDSQGMHIPGFEIVTQHAVVTCAECWAAADYAVSLARVTGSTGGTYTDGTHRAAVTRLSDERVTFLTELCSTWGSKMADLTTATFESRRGGYEDGGRA